ARSGERQVRGTTPQGRRRRPGEKNDLARRTGRPEGRTAKRRRPVRAGRGAAAFSGGAPPLSQAGRPSPPPVTRPVPATDPPGTFGPRPGPPALPHPDLPGPRRRPSAAGGWLVWHGHAYVGGGTGRDRPGRGFGPCPARTLHSGTP